MATERRPRGQALFCTRRREERRTSEPGLAGEKGKRQEPWITSSCWGDKWTQETEEALKKAVGTEFVSKADFNAANEPKKKLEGDLTARDTELNAMKTQAGDGAALSATLAQMKVDQDKTAKAHAAELESVRRDAAIEVALLTAKARNPKMDIEEVRPDRALCEVA